MGIQWTSVMAVGVDKIDSQHRELFDRINQLLDACSQGKGNEAINQTVEFLSDYVVTHFQTEEKLMREANYPDYPKHKGYHDEFIAKLGELKEQIKKGGAQVNVVILTNRLVVGWLNTHILNVDKEFGKFLNSK